MGGSCARDVGGRRHRRSQADIVGCATGGAGEASRSWKLELDYRLFGIYLGAWTWSGPSRASQPPWAGTTSEPALVGLVQRGRECGHVSAENIR